MSLPFYRPSFQDSLLAYATHCSPQQFEVAMEYLDVLKNDANCYERSNMRGHFTGSSVVVDPDELKMLLTHHAKTHCWLQLGGHCDGLRDPFFVAWKEAYEESGLRHIAPVDGAILDLDAQVVPAYRELPAHVHRDVRYLFWADSRKGFVKSDESLDLAWVSLDRVEEYTQDLAVIRLAAKALLHLSGKGAR